LVASREVEWAEADSRVAQAATAAVVVADSAWVVAAIGAAHRAGPTATEAGWARRVVEAAVREGLEARVGAAAVSEMPERAAVPNAEHKSRLVGQACHTHTHI
jgi:hypothetical protein